MRRLAQRLALAPGAVSTTPSPGGRQLTGVGPAIRGAAACGATADRCRRHVPVVAGTAPGTQDLAALTAARSRRRPSCSPTSWLPLAFLVSGGTARENDSAGSDVGCGVARRADRLRRRRRRAGTPAPASGQAGGALRQRRRLGEVTVRQLVRQACACAPIASWSARSGRRGGGSAGGVEHRHDGARARSTPTAPRGPGATGSVAALAAWPARTA
ncbi:putative conjugative transfer protein TrbB [Mycobacterium xenopi 4042]|uniref:Putative conjugative transfer protein TrbB n=1 Tax=Mycobacterium xenopi 4042 TaxID=1299334 RepID=X7ZYU5_MYCXE|nr:putative conjugative transfer protein TrbB [Mycobacterium xenopi 4042]